MLRTSDLLVLGEELAPPVGYEADAMVAMTYSLDLAAVLALPLAVVRQGTFAGETAESADRYATLEAITRIAPRFRVIYDMAGLQAGRWSRLLEALGGVTVPVALPRRGLRRPAFHPKVVLIRFVKEGAPQLVRLLCMSRNLTGDAALDVSIALEGEVEAGQRPTGDIRLAAALRRLLAWTVNPEQADAARELVEGMAESVQRVHWRAPKGFRHVAVWPMGFDDDGFDPVKGRPDEHRRLVMSPFLRDKRLRDLAPRHGKHVLISEETALDTIPGSTLDVYEVLRIDPQRIPGGCLHAKLYISEGPRHRRWVIGSANATIAGAERNAELMVELETSARGPGIDDLMTGEEGIRAMLIPYDSSDRELKEPTEPSVLENLLRELTACRFVAKASRSGDGTYDVSIDVEPSLPITSGTVRVWFQDPARAVLLDPRQTPSALLMGIKRRELSRFLTVEISHDDQVVRRRVVMTIEGIDLEELAQDALASVFRDDSGMEQLRYFERLLSGSTAEVLSLTFDQDEEDTIEDGGGDGASRRSGSSTAALLEPLLAALEKGEAAAGRDPIIQSLGYLVDASRDQLPDDFVELWDSTRKLLGL
jgi:hypothetical protein